MLLFLAFSVIDKFSIFIPILLSLRRSRIEIVLITNVLSQFSQLAMTMSNRYSGYAKPERPCFKLIRDGIRFGEFRTDIAGMNLSFPTMKFFIRNDNHDHYNMLIAIG
jgi:hypothetical protein